MTGIRTFDASPQAALGFLIAQTTHIEANVWARRYPDITYQDFVPVDFSANPWAPSITYFSTDRIGSAKWGTGTMTDFPFSEVERSKFETAVHIAAAGYKYGIEEINQARMLGMNLPGDKAAAARRAYEEMTEKVAFFGDAAKSFKGLTNYVGITTVAAPNGAAASPLWSSKTPNEILNDMNNLVAGIYINSLTTEMADTIVLPLASFSYISVTPVNNLSSMTILEYIKQNNIFTATTGRPLTIKAMRQLDTAGAGATKR
ncbi:MAG: major capsid family protein, partial [Hyphomicrobium sp.]